MNLRAGTFLGLTRTVWPREIDHEERTPQNAFGRLLEIATVIGCEWLPPKQHMVVRLRGHLGEMCLTKREIELNGATDE